MYTTLLFLHSWVRWLVLISAAIVMIRSLVGWIKKKDWSVSDDRFNKIFVIGFDTQLLLGILLYFVSPIIQIAHQLPMADAMRDPITRFWMVEHAVMMLIAAGVFHMGKAITRKRTTGPRRQLFTFIYVLVGLLLVCSAIPWPSRVMGRPLFRGL
jgi:hypothetical protein